MKFALNVLTLVVGVALCTASVQSFSNNQDIVLKVMANDKVWAKHLDVNVKLHPEKLTTVTRRMLVNMKLMDAVLIHEEIEEGGEEKVVEQKQAEKKIPPLVVQALHVVTDVASFYSDHGIALELALETIVLAIKCKTLKYILVQLYAIRKIIELQNEEITSQPIDVWNMMVQILSKIAVFKESVDEEFEIFQQWEEIANLNMTKELPRNFENFMSLVSKMLEESCDLCSFTDILKQMDFDENCKSTTDTVNIFKKCQDILEAMFYDIPIRTIGVKVWEEFLNKPKFIEPSVLPLSTTV